MGRIKVKIDWRDTKMPKFNVDIHFDVYGSDFKENGLIRLSWVVRCRNTKRRNQDQVLNKSPHQANSLPGRLADQRFCKE